MTTTAQARASLAARLAELARLQIYLEGTDLTLDDLRAYVVDRIEKVLPVDYHVYRRRWQALPPGDAPSPLLPFLEWHVLLLEMEELGRLAEMLEEEPEGARWAELRKLLLVSEGVMQDQDAAD